MRFDRYYRLDESSYFMSEIGKLNDLSWSQVRKRFLDAWNQIKKFLSDKGADDEAVRIINKHLKTNYKTLADVSDKLTEGTELNEDAAHWWDLIKTEAFPTLSFYPALQCWLELDKLLKNQGYSAKAMVVYAVFWLVLVSAKYIKGWWDWKKANPEEYEDEKEMKKGRA